MARSSKIKAILEAQDRASPVFKRVSGTVKALGAVAAAVGAVAIGRQLVGGIQKAVAAAGVQEKSEVKLAQALRLTGKSVAETLPGLKAYASQLQDLTGVGDELILSNQSLLVGLGKLEGEGLQRATKAALDLAAATGTEMRTAFDLVAKAATGYTGTLSRYGIIIDQALPASEKFAAALSKIEENFGGQAQAQLKTFEGRLQELKGRVGDLQEAIGGPLRDVMTIFLGELISPAIDKLGDAVSESDLLKRSVVGLAIVMAEMGAAIAQVVEGPLLALSVIIGSRLQRDFDLLKTGVAIFATDMLDDLLLVQQMFQGMFGDSVVAERLNATADRLRELLDDTKAGAEEVKEGFDETVSVIVGGIITAQSAISEAVQIGADATKARLEATDKQIERLGQTISRSLRGVGVNSALAFGDALVDAAFEGGKSFGEMFRNLARDLTAAIAKALILKSILGAFGLGGFGGFFQGGGVVPQAVMRGGLIGAQSGLMVPGLNMNKDSVPILAQPGEMVLPRDISDAILSSVRGGGQEGVTEIHLHGSLPALVTEINSGVRNGEARLLASDIVANRSTR